MTQVSDNLYAVKNLLYRYNSREFYRRHKVVLTLTMLRVIP